MFPQSNSGAVAQYPFRSDASREIIDATDPVAQARYWPRGRYRPLWDEKGTSVRAYKVPGTSYVVIIDPKGTVVYTGLGGKQDFEEALKRAVG